MLNASTNRYARRLFGSLSKHGRDGKPTPGEAGGGGGGDKPSAEGPAEVFGQGQHRERQSLDGAKALRAHELKLLNAQSDYGPKYGPAGEGGQREYTPPKYFDAPGVKEELDRVVAAVAEAVPKAKADLEAEGKQHEDAKKLLDEVRGRLAAEGKALPGGERRTLAGAIATASSKLTRAGVNVEGGKKMLDRKVDETRDRIAAWTKKNDAGTLSSGGDESPSQVARMASGVFYGLDNRIQDRTTERAGALGRMSRVITALDEAKKKPAGGKP